MKITTLRKCHFCGAKGKHAPKLTKTRWRGRICVRQYACGECFKVYTTEEQPAK